MARLPQPGGDSGTWGTVLNEFLAVSHNTDGTVKSGAVTKSDVGLGNVNNTSDANKPISTAQQAALDARIVWVDSSGSPSVARPSDAQVVFWIGGTTQPTNMATGDVWLKEV